MKLGEEAGRRDEPSLLRVPPKPHRKRERWR